MTTVDAVHVPRNDQFATNRISFVFPFINKMKAIILSLLFVGAAVALVMDPIGMSLLL
jgi:hypothetical protein